MCACSLAVDAMINHHVHTQRWRIANVSKLPTAIGARVVSDQFEAFGRAWEIGLFPGGMKPENKDSVQAYLRMTTETAIPLLVKFEFALIDHAGERHTFFVDFSEVSTHKAKCATLGLRATLFDAAKGFAVADVIQLECYMEALLQLHSHRNLAKALAPLVESQQFADVTLQCEGKQLPAHKVILAARSSTLASNSVRHRVPSPSRKFRCRCCEPC